MNRTEARLEDLKIQGVLKQEKGQKVVTATRVVVVAIGPYWLQLQTIQLVFYLLY